MQRNLILTAIGDGNVLDTWFDRPDQRQFDLFVVDFRPGPRAAPPHATYFVEHAGFKPEHLGFVAANFEPELRRYDCIWCPDDDIALDTASINAMFSMFERYRLQLAQPAIAEGDVSFQSFRPQPGAVLRYTPFVEIMCPLFTCEAFFRVRHTFAASRSGWGIDLVWPQFFGQRDLAILDSIHARHMRPLEIGELYVRLKKLGIDPRQERDEVVRRWGGISERAVRRMHFGKQPMPTLFEPGFRRGLWRRVSDRIMRRAA
ncbi:MAG TPA: hypothetical protein VGY55_06575 [Pirellulales bacterium]|jgi:hypothetical protein|nr:hypothetical protein [Pirellulales bacterium]